MYTRWTSLDDARASSSTTADDCFRDDRLLLLDEGRLLPRDDGRAWSMTADDCLGDGRLLPRMQLYVTTVC
jgi:hypothetical protein